MYYNLDMFEQNFKNIDKILREDDGIATELEYAEQTSWILFLKWIDDYEKEKEKKNKLDNKLYKPILSKEFQWSSWAVIKTEDGKIDFNKNLQGKDLKNFVDDKLFPYLSTLKDKTENINSLEYKIGEIFSELKNKLQDGYTLRDMLEAVDKLQFKSSDEKHELSALYEERIKKMGNAGRNGGEYYTPRSLIKAIVKVINPKIGETIYDGAVGSAGFLVETFEYINKSKSLTSSEYDILQTKTLYGAEKKILAYIIGNMNMILHGVESPNIYHINSLSQNIMEIQNKDRVDVILANPPFGSQSEKLNIQENFPIKSGETAYLFLQHFIKKLKLGGRCGVVIKNTFLTNDDAMELRKQLLEECNLSMILDLPKGTFQGAGVQTVVLFFEKGKPTKKIWYYKLNPGRNLGKTNALNMNDLDEFINLTKTKKPSDNSWSIDIKKINKETYDLGVSNPNIKEELDERTPLEIISEIEEFDKQSAAIFKKIKDLL
jgi:type I restriction enzyme M protein